MVSIADIAKNMKDASNSSSAFLIAKHIDIMSIIIKAKNIFYPFSMVWGGSEIWLIY